MQELDLREKEKKRQLIITRLKAEKEALQLNLNVHDRELQKLELKNFEINKLLAESNQVFSKKIKNIR